MSKKLKKSLSWLLALCMILSLLPMSVFAASGSATKSGKYVTLDYGTGSANLSITVNVYYNNQKLETFSVNNGARTANQMHISLKDSEQNNYDIETVTINPGGGAILTAEDADAWDLGIWNVGTDDPDVTIDVTLCNQFKEPEIEGGVIDTAGVIYYRAYDAQLLKMLYLAGDPNVNEQTDIKSVQIRFVKNLGASNTWSMIEMPSAAKNLHYFYPTAGLSNAGGLGNPNNIRQLEITYEQDGQEKTAIISSGDLLYSNIGGNTYEIKANATGADSTSIVAFYNEDDGLQDIYSLYAVRFVNNNVTLVGNMPEAPEYNNSEYIFANWAYDPNGGDAFLSTTLINGDVDVYAMKVSSASPGGTEYHVLNRDNLLLKRFVELYNAQNPTATIDSTDIDWNNIKIAVNGADNETTNKDYYINEWKNNGDYYYVNNYTAEGAIGDTLKNTHIPVNEISGITIYAKDVSGNDLNPVFISRGDNRGQLKIEQTEYDHIIDLAIIEAPTKPSDSDLTGDTNAPGILGKIKVQCTNTEADHKVTFQDYAVLSDSCDVGEVTAQADGGYTCDVTVKSDPYITEFNKDTGNVTHTLEKAPEPITLTWNDTTCQWDAPKDALPVTFEVTCEPTTPSDPDKPAKPTVNDLGFIKVKVVCNNNQATHSSPEPYGLLEGGFNIGEVQGDATSGYTCTVTVSPDAYVTQYNTDTGVNHTLDPNTQDSKDITVISKAGSWIAEDPSAATVEYKVKCTASQQAITFTYKAGANGTLTGAVSEEVPVFNGTSAYPTNVPTPNPATGYQFAGWQIGDPSSDPLVSTETLKGMKFSENTTFTAIFKAEETPAPETITFTYKADANGTLTGAVSEEVPVFNGTSAYPTNVPTPKPATGYQFAGWQIDGKPSSDPLVSTETLKSMKFSEDTTFTAIFKEDFTQQDLISYTVKYFFNGKEDKKAELVVYGNVWVNAEKELTVDEDTIIRSFEGYTFDHSNPANLPYAAKDGAVIELYYVSNPVTKFWTVSFDSNGGSAVASQRVRNGNTAYEPKDPTRSGYWFVGWYTKYGKAYDFDTPVTGNITLYARWERKTSIEQRFTIEATAHKGGEISPDGIYKVYKYSDKTYTITADKGYKIYDVVVDGVSVGAVHTYTFERVTEDHTIEVYFAKLPTDPDDSGTSNWLETKDHVAYMTGYPDGTFGPNRNMTRAEVAQMFYALLLNKNVTTTVAFSDVSADAWYAKAVNTLASLGMVSGYPDGTFHPDAPITRAEFATIALAFAYEPLTASCNYNDVPTSAWFYTYVAQATTYGWIGGSNGYFRPNDNITRAEVSVIVNNMLGRAADEDYVDEHADDLVTFPDVRSSFWGYYSIMETVNDHEYVKLNGLEDWK